ncbi:MaoC family dehydratase [Leucobacter sp. W1038]|uniref:MaoC family dehydratase n=1 Tax=Leucobacter sp. W1038 TaxID=3438281 RepID=UPI003D98C92E
MTTMIPFAELPEYVGKDLGYTDWFEITQDRVNLFADAADDHQWIHVDPVRAADGPFGAPIAHGFLTLSLLIPLQTALFDIEGASTKVNYGLDKVRFVSPVPVGSKVRLTATIAEVLEVPGGLQAVIDVVIELEGGTKPAVVARSLQRFYA